MSRTLPGLHAPGRQPKPSAKARVLMDLFPTFEGFAGIPQETRLIFASFARSRAIDVDGMMNGGTYVNRYKAKPGASEDARVFQQARAILAHENSRYDMPWWFPTPLLKVLPGSFRGRLHNMISVGSLAGSNESLDNPIDPAMFGDFMWTRMFDRTLAASERDILSQATLYSTVTSAHRARWLAYIGSGARIKVDTRDHNVFFSPTVSPYRVAPGTRLLVRFHDAIPILYPHTIGEAWPHAHSFYRILKGNVADGATFFCDSEPVRADLLRIFPQAEGRVHTMPVMSAPEYFPEYAPDRVIRSILKRRVCDATKAKEVKAEGEGDKDASKKGLTKYFMAVSTLEPRKNYRTLLKAFDAARRMAKSSVKLVLVANPGWNCEAELAEIRSLVADGSVVHLARVPLEELRLLYSRAHAVICPSRTEGFDLSGVEAMQCGAPVLASGIPVHRWVYGEGAEYFDPYDWEAMADIMGQVADARRDSGRLGALAERGVRQATCYTPEALTPRWEQVIEDLSSTRRPVEVPPDANRPLDPASFHGWNEKEA